MPAELEDLIAAIEEANGGAAALLENHEASVEPTGSSTDPRF